jgi:hypothetical protein
MKLSVQFEGSVPRPQGLAQVDWQGPAGCSLERVLLDLGFRAEQLRFLVGVVDGVSVPALTHSPKDGASVLIITTIGGG